MLRRFLPVMFLLVWSGFACAQATSDLQLLTETLPAAPIGKPYNATIQITGGTPPLNFRITRGTLPKGVALQSASGILSGTPTQPGTDRFTLEVTDARGKRLVHEFTLRVEDYLVVLFKAGPTLNSNELSGSVEVKNQSDDNYDLTLIVVAVNQIGKAFALGYQHFDFAPRGDQVIPFSSTLPNGSYTVHVDAIAKIAGRNLTRYASLQTQSSIVVNVNR